MTSLFCDGEVFPLDRGLLMGTSISSRKQSMLITYTIKMKRANPRNRFALIEKTISQIF
jgi:hypothetical protein